MAVVTTKATTITNRDATPKVINDARLERGTLKSAQGYVTAVSGDSIGSKYIVAQIPSTAVVKAVKVNTDAITTCAGDVGLYRPTAVDGTAGAVISAAFFGSAVSLASVLTNSDVTNESTNFTIDKRDQPIWQASGLTADPGGMLDVAITLTAAAGSGGKVGLVVDYVDNGS